MQNNFNTQQLDKTDFRINILEMTSLIKSSGPVNESEPLSQALRSKNSSETILIEKDYKNTVSLLFYRVYFKNKYR
jgi:hypothetical protein